MAYGNEESLNLGGKVGKTGYKVNGAMVMKDIDIMSPKAIDESDSIIAEEDMKEEESSEGSKPSTIRSSQKGSESIKTESEARSVEEKESSPSENDDKSDDDSAVSNPYEIVAPKTVGFSKQVDEKEE